MIEILLQAERAMSVGLLDQAERLYGQAAASDPRNSIAVVGLARVALERGDDRGAYGLGLRALEIDPENEAARRLVDRLGEVMRHRGETVPDAAAAVPGAEGPESSAPAVEPAEPSAVDAASPPSEPAAERRPGRLRRLLRFGR